MDPAPELSTLFDEHFEALSYRFRVVSDLEDAGEVIRRLLAHFRVGGHADGGPAYVLTKRETTAAIGGRELPFELLKEGSSVQQVTHPGSMLDWLIADLSQQAVMSTPLLSVHAGVVALGGQALVLPAPPDAGKTTLTVGLTRSGFSFLSDEVAAIDADTSLVHPFPRPILMDPESMEVVPGLMERLPEAYESFRLRRYHVAPDDLRPGALGDPCPIRFVVSPRYKATGPTQLAPLSRAEALHLLAQQCFNFERLGRRGLDALVSVVRGADCYRLMIGDLSSAVAAIEDLFSR